MDETAIAFELPHARASATHVGPPLDRISVRDYTRSVEIGAFRTERGVTQRIRFNVVLEVGHHSAAEDDDVDKVISYDTITEAIEAELAAERINLLETLAERVAARCLADPRAVRAFVRIEKLDRIPGALGVEIVRTRPAAAGDARACAPSPPRARRAPAVRPARRLPARRRGRRTPRRRLARRPRRARPPARRLPRAGDALPPPRRARRARRIGLLAIEQAAWAFTEGDDRFGVAATRTELDWALKTGRLSVWAPAAHGHRRPRPPGPRRQRPRRPRRLARRGTRRRARSSSPAPTRRCRRRRVPVRAVAAPADLAGS